MKSNKPISLLAKWLPSENASSNATKKSAKIIRDSLNMSSVEYRKYLSKLRKYLRLIENYLRERDYNFDYAFIPSKAILKYKDSFERNDKERYESYINKVVEGTAKINTKTLTPANIILNLRDATSTQDKMLDAQWQSILENFELLNNINAIVACDVSGSMTYGIGEAPINVSIGLALFFAYKNTGAYQGYFIDFCGQSRLHKIDLNKSIRENYESILHSSLDMSTNIDSVFKTLLDSAVNHNIKQEDLPKYVIIISDMEFNMCCNNNNEINFKHWQKSFESKGYKLPIIVFWNADNRNNIAPARHNEGVVFLSGRSQNGFKILNTIENYGIIDSKSLSMQVMMDTLREYDRFFK